MTNVPALEQNRHAKWLRLLATEIRAEGHPGWVHTIEFAADEIDKLVREAHQLRLDLAQHKGNASEVTRLQAKLKEIARLLDEGAYGMATDEARGA